MLKLIFAIAIVITILIAGWVPFRKRQKEPHHNHDFMIGETLATGVFLGAALLHMLPEANELFTQLDYGYPYAFLITGAVFLFFLWFEHLGGILYAAEQTCSKDSHPHAQQKKSSNHPAFAILACFMLSIHSLILGTALGINHNTSIVIMLFLAIITHKWAESFAIAVQLNKSSLSLRWSSILFLIFVSMTPLGIWIGWYFQQGIDNISIINPILIAASAGTFLYLGTLHGLEQCVMVKRCCNLLDFSYVIIGFLLMAAVAAYT